MVAEHHESLSRGNDLPEHNFARFYGENQTMMDRWGELIRNDPFYNPHFSHETGMFEKLSSASLSLARAPALLRTPLVRPVPPPGKAYPEPTQPAAPGAVPPRCCRGAPS